MERYTFTSAKFIQDILQFLSERERERENKERERERERERESVCGREHFKFTNQLYS